MKILKFCLFVILAGIAWFGCKVWTETEKLERQIVELAKAETILLLDSQPGSEQVEAWTIHDQGLITPENPEQLSFVSEMFGNAHWQRHRLQNRLQNVKLVGVTTVIAFVSLLFFSVSAKTRIEKGENSEKAVETDPEAPDGQDPVPSS